ncbi:hypothetical protein T484DRAFT_1865170 [Baffinella frigidus]|nr:hypothetical protein T484DRAFT_1865170 [Cryptophyta sp. CCMP2293]
MYMAVAETQDPKSACLAMMKHMPISSKFRAVAATQDPKSACLAMMKHMKIDPKKFRLGSTMILLKREVVDSMEKERARLPQP